MEEKRVYNRPNIIINFGVLINTSREGGRGSRKRKGERGRGENEKERWWWRESYWKETKNGAIFYYKERQSQVSEGKGCKRVTDVPASICLIIIIIIFCFFYYYYDYCFIFPIIKLDT